MKPVMPKTFMPRFGLSFKVVSESDPGRGKPVEGEVTDRGVLRNRTIATSLQMELADRYMQVWRANNLNLSQGDNRGEFELTRVDDEPFYGTVLVGEDSYLYRALGKLRQAIEKKTLPYGILINLEPQEEEKVLAALSDAQNKLVEGLERSRLDIVV